MLFFQEDLDLSPYLREAMAVTQQPIKEVQSRVGRTDDIRAIVLTGGCAGLFAPTIRAAFPQNRLHVMGNPCYANVDGFYTIGSARQASK